MADTSGAVVNSTSLDRRPLFSKHQQRHDSHSPEGWRSAAPSRQRRCCADSAEWGGLIDGRESTGNSAQPQVRCFHGHWTFEYDVINIEVCTAQHDVELNLNYHGMSAVLLLTVENRIDVYCA